MKKIGILTTLLLSTVAFSQEEAKNLKPKWELNKKYEYIVSSNYSSTSDFEVFDERMGFRSPMTYQVLGEMDNNLIVYGKVPNTNIIKVLNFFSDSENRYEEFKTIDLEFFHNKSTGENLLMNWEMVNDISKRFIEVMKTKLKRYPSEEARLLVYLTDFEKQIHNQADLNILFKEEMEWFTNGLNRKLELDDDIKDKNTFQFPTVYSIPCETKDEIHLNDINTELKLATFSWESELNDDNLKESFIKELEGKKKSKTITAAEQLKLDNKSSLTFETEIKETYILDYEQTIPSKIELEYSIKETSDLGVSTHNVKTLIAKAK